jgi:hypothetical protein
VFGSSHGRAIVDYLLHFGTSVLHLVHAPHVARSGLLGLCLAFGVSRWPKRLSAAHELDGLLDALLAGLLVARHGLLLDLELQELGERELWLGAGSFLLRLGFPLLLFQLFRLGLFHLLFGHYFLQILLFLAELLAHAVVPPMLLDDEAGVLLDVELEADPEAAPDSLDGDDGSESVFSFLPHDFARFPPVDESLDFHGRVLALGLQLPHEPHSPQDHRQPQQPLHDLRSPVHRVAKLYEAADRILQQCLVREILNLNLGFLLFKIIKNFPRLVASYAGLNPASHLVIGEVRSEIFEGHHPKPVLSLALDGSELGKGHVDLTEASVSVEYCAAAQVLGDRGGRFAAEPEDSTPLKLQAPSHDDLL